MFHKRPFSRTSYVIFILFVSGAMLLASCGGLPIKLAATPTQLAATSTPMVVLSTPATSLPSPTPVVNTATPMPPTSTATPVLAQDTTTPVLANNPVPLNQAVVATLLPTSSAATPTVSMAAAVATPAIPVAMGSFNLITGTSAGVIQGTVQPGQVLEYSIGAGQGQPLTLIMDSPHNDVTLGFFDASHVAILDPARKLRAWQMALPATETYTIQIIGGAITENFTLTVKLPVVVSFATGTSSTNLSGTTVNGYLFAYSFACAEGQTMSAILNQPPSTATIDIYGLDTGTVLEASSNVSSWTGILPQNQDYIIEVIPTNGQVVNYNLSVSCTGTPVTVTNPPVYTGGPGGGSIYFAPNTTAAVVQGTINPGQIIAYTVQANQYQAMTLKVEATNKDVTLIVLDPSGNLAFDPAKLYANWQWVLPQTGLYTIKLVGGAYTELYTLTTKVAERIAFPSGTHSMIIYGTNHGGLIQSYSIKLSAGDTLSVSLDVPSSKAYLDVYGVLTGSVLSFSAHANSWTGTLPATQVYVIEVIPTGGYLMSYGLTVSVP
ncbi:MAG TPA: hypothetical protein VMT91_04385 [Anaerolineales bacterium]|nr:hypothetical protein [Anaerolineales bacterium]